MDWLIGVISVKHHHLYQLLLLTTTAAAAAVESRCKSTAESEVVSQEIADSAKVVIEDEHPVSAPGVVKRVADTPGFLCKSIDIVGMTNQRKKLMAEEQ